MNSTAAVAPGDLIAAQRHSGPRPIPGQRAVCPGLSAALNGLPVTVHPGARLSDLDRIDVRLRCLARPGVLLRADYVRDVCLATRYCTDCVFFQPRPALED